MPYSENWAQIKCTFKFTVWWARLTHLIFLECVNFGSTILSYVLFVHSFLNMALPQPFHSLYHTSLWCDMTQTALTSRVRSWYSFIIASSETSLGFFFSFLEKPTTLKHLSLIEMHVFIKKHIFVICATPITRNSAILMKS